MTEAKFFPFPVLATDRLILRQLKITDDEDIFAHRCDDNVNTYLENWRYSSVEEARAFISRVQKEIAEGKTILWVITKKGMDRFMGTICLWNISRDEHRAETGYTLVSEFHGMGYMNEALERVVDFGFNKMNLKTIEAYTHENNESSVKLLQKNKFKQGIPKKEVSSNRIYFSLNKEI